MAKRVSGEVFRTERLPYRDGRPGICNLCGGAVVEDVERISSERLLKRKVCRTCRAEYGTSGQPVRHH